MKIMTRLTIKEILNNKKVFILCFISVLLSCILLFTVGLSFSTIRQNQINSVINIYGDHHAVIYNTTTLEKDKLNDDRILKYSYIFKIENNLYSISDNFDLSFNLNGKLPTDNNEIMISSNKAYLDNLTIGSSLKIDDKKYEVVGIYDSFELQKLNLDNIVITKEDEINSEAIYFIYLKSYKDIYNNIRDIAINLSNSKYSINNSLLYYYAGADPNSNYVNNSDAVYFLLTMFICLILAFIIFFIIYNAFSISVNEKKKKYAMYKSIGATPKQILCSVFLESLIVLVIAIPLGFLLSLGFISLILLIINNMLEGIAPNIYTLETYPTFIFISLIFILVSTLFATFSVARMASRINIIDEVRQNKKFKYRKSNKLIKKILGIECLISANNVTRDRAKYRITTISVVIGVILFLTSTTLLSISLYQTSDDKLNDYISVTIYDNLKKEEIINTISKLEAVDNFVYFKYEYYTFKTTNNFDNITNNFISYLYINEDKYNELKEHYNIDNDYPFLINTLSNGNKIFTDDIVELELMSEETNQNIIVNTVDDYGIFDESYGYYFTPSMHPVIIGKYNDNINSSINISIQAKDYLKLDQEIKALIEIDENVDYWNTYVINHNNRVLTNCIKLIIYLSLLFITFITVVSIIGTISASLNLRRKEFAILKSIGLSNKQFNKMIFYESLMLSLKSLLFGFLIFILIVSIFLRISMINENTFDSLLDLPLSIFIPPLIVCIIGVIVIVYLSFLIATNKIKKDNIVDILKVN